MLTKTLSNHNNNNNNGEDRVYLITRVFFRKRKKSLFCCLLGEAELLFILEFWSNNEAITNDEHKGLKSSGENELFRENREKRSK